MNQADLMALALYNVSSLAKAILTDYVPYDRVSENRGIEYANL